MANLLGVNTGGDTQLDQLVNAFRQTQQPQVDNLQNRKQQLTRQQTYFNQLNNRLNSFITQLDNLSGDDISDDFAAKKVDSSDDNYVTATASATALRGVNTVKVERLATSDILISDRMQSEEVLGLTGTFTVSMRGSEGENVSVDVELDGSETNLQAMNKLATAINDNDDLQFNVGVVRDTTTTARLTIRSQITGSDNAVSFVDSPLLAAFGLDSAALGSGDSRALNTDSTAGFKVSDVADLNSRAEINGIGVTRGSNTIDDALEGVAFQLIKPQEETDSEVLLTTDVNDTAVEDMIEPFLGRYNDVMNFLTSNEGRDMRRGDPAISSLYQRMRFIVADRVTTQDDGGPEYLANLGIEADNRGLLRITDREKLVDLLEENAQFVANLFSSEDGIISKMQNAVDTLKGEDGLITQRSLSLSDQIDAQDDRIEQLERRLDRQSESLRKQYTSLLEALFEQQGQTSAFGAFNQGLAAQ
jgi:flagellar hook-associated protein 2